MAGKFALIIGNSEYQDPNLTLLKAPEADVNALSALLRDSQIGAFDEVITLANEMSATIRRAIAHFFAQKTSDDLLLLYFSGHGVLDDRGELFLATKDTERDLIRGTAIPAAYITGEMDGSRSRRQVLILDCCHSGAFARGSKGVVGASVGTAAAFQGIGYGRAVLTATDATQFAWEGDQVIGQAVNSLFTHYLIEGLRTGEADTDTDGRITLDNLYDYVYEQVVKTTPKQTPGKWSYRQQGEIVIANNPKPAIKPAELPHELRDAIESPVAGAREGTVRELERLLNGRHPGLALAAYDALTRLADDDSRRVANAATQVLNTYNEAKRAQESARAEQERAAIEQAEAVRVAQEKEEKQRLAREKSEQERIAKEKIKAERIAREKAEKQRRVEEKAEAEKVARQKAEQERAAREKAETERIARQKAEVERLAQEKAEAEPERVALENSQAVETASTREMSVPNLVVTVSRNIKLLLIGSGIVGGIVVLAFIGWSIFPRTLGGQAVPTAYVAQQVASPSSSATPFLPTATTTPILPTVIPATSIRQVSVPIVINESPSQAVKLMQDANLRALVVEEPDVVCNPRVIRQDPMGQVDVGSTVKIYVCVGPTPTPRPTDTPRPTVTPMPTASPTRDFLASSFLDDFSRQQLLGVLDRSWCKSSYEGGQYHFRVTEQFTICWETYSRRYASFSLEVDATMYSGEGWGGGGASLIFGYVDSDNFYKFTVTRFPSNYIVVRLVDKKWQDIRSWNTGAVIKGPDPNGISTAHMKVVVQGQKLQVYTADRLLDTLTIPDYRGGGVGISAETWGQDAHVSFGNLKMELLP